MNKYMPILRCDECGREMAKAHRVHKERRYCSTCYARLFKRRTCPKCGKPARLPKFDPEAICRTCQNNRPCVRCKKAEYKTGLITPYGPVCTVCAHYFKKPEPCELCGSLSTRLARITRQNNKFRVCPKCYRVDHSTCEACHRYRLLLLSPDGRMLCKICNNKGDSRCIKCGNLMPAGYGKQCQDCYWYNLLLKRIKINCAAFSSQQMADHFTAFGQWLGLRQGNNKAALTINKYLLFFTDIEQQWQLIPNFHVLLNHFGTLRLRRVLLPMRWMEENHLIVSDDEAKKEDSEKRRIASILDKIPNNSLERSILDAYHRNLVNKLQQKKITLRSVRLALTPAAALLLVARKKGNVPPNQLALDGYLGKTPGQRASVSGFVRYLNKKYGAGIALPKINLNKSQKNRRKKLEVKILSLMSESLEYERGSRKWLSIALAYFHGLPEKVGHVIKLENVSLEEDEGVSVIWNEMSYWIPVFSDKGTTGQ